MAMVTVDPALDPRRRRKERGIWFVDMFMAAIITACGVAMVFFTSDYVDDSVKWPWAIALMGWLMLGGGLLTFSGRLSRFWAIELPGIVGAGIGAFLYGLVLANGIYELGTSFVPFGLVLVAAMIMYRRYTELRILVSEPGDLPLSKRIAELLLLRTENVVRRHYF